MRSGPRFSLPLFSNSVVTQASQVLLVAQLTMPPHYQHKRFVKIEVVEEEEPDWLASASFELFGPTERNVEIVPEKQAKQQRRVKIEKRGAKSQSTRQMQSTRPKSTKPTQPTQSTRHVYIAGKPVLSSSTNRHSTATINKQKARSLDTLISQHAKGFSTLVEKRINGKNGKKSRVKQAAIALAVQRLEENLGTSFDPQAQQQQLVQPWFGM